MLAFVQRLCYFDVPFSYRVCTVSMLKKTWAIIIKCHDFFIITKKKRLNQTDLWDQGIHNISHLYIKVCICNCQSSTACFVCVPGCTRAAHHEVGSRWRWRRRGNRAGSNQCNPQPTKESRSFPTMVPYTLSFSVPSSEYLKVAKTLTCLSPF